MVEKLLQVKNLVKHFPIRKGFFRRTVGAVKAVDGIDFYIRQGECLGMVGESGCGKSTVGRAAIRLLEPTDGSIHFLGQDLRALAPSALRRWRRQVQVIFQDPLASLNPRKTIVESIGDPLLHHGLAIDLDERDAQVAQVLIEVGLTPDAMNRYPHQFSGGQQQRICIGRALALKPKLIICDEAVSALDVSVQAQILNLLADLREKHNLSYLFISHDLSVVRHLCDRVVVLYLGKVVEVAGVDELFTDPKHPYTQFLLSAVPKEHPNEKRSPLHITGEIPSPSNPPKGCPFHTRCPYAQPICAQEPPPTRSFVGKDGLRHEYHCVIS